LRPKTQELEALVLQNIRSLLKSQRQIPLRQALGTFGEVGGMSRHPGARRKIRRPAWKDGMGV